MSLAHVAVLGAAVMTLLALPCAVLALRSFDEAAQRRREWVRRPAEETRALHELDRALQERDDLPARDRPAHDRPAHDRPAHDRPAHDRPAHDRPAHDRPAHDRPALDWPVLDDAPAQTIGDIARELRRLDRQRRGGPTLESQRWLEAVLRAYDDGLCRACRCVGVQEHLEPLEGMDREIERVRVEGALEAAGVPLR